LSHGMSLHDEDVWIGDTGATTHSTEHVKHTFNHHDGTTEGALMGAYGRPAEVKLVVYIPCVMEDSKGGRTI
jgi:hypothetical protein